MYSWLLTEHRPKWPTDPDSNPDQTRMRPGLIKVEAYAEIYIWPQLANNCMVQYHCNDYLPEQKVAKCVVAGCTAS